ncbi:MAG: DUF433 domain-containing protein [Phycisphaerales bacterium]|nr:DUF433 domain-containing protein [Phycisphaerales bacterium]
MGWQDRVISDPNICHGKACIKGTRVMVSVIIDNVAEGESPQKIAAAYHIDPQDVRAALLYVAELARERVVPLPAGASG